MSSARTSARERRENARASGPGPSPAERVAMGWAGLASAEQLAGEIKAHHPEWDSRASEAMLAQLRQALEVQEDNLDV